MTDENKNGKSDEAEVVEAEGKLPFVRFVLRELRKLLEKTGAVWIPIVLGGSSGGAVGLAGWIFQGRPQATEIAVDAARKEVRLSEEFETFMRLKQEQVAAAAVAPVNTGVAQIAPVASSTIAPVITVAIVLPPDAVVPTTPLVDQSQEQIQQAIRQFAETRGADAETTKHLQERGFELLREWEAEERRASRERFQEPPRLIMGGGPDLQQLQDQDQQE